MPPLDLFEEANRQLTICNACRYCEGYCAVFRAIETRRDFLAGDVLYLSHLCHDCRACYYACMYAPPHEFAINIPQIMSEVRIASYRRWSWPQLLARCFTDRRIGVGLGLVTALVVVILSVVLVSPDVLFSRHLGPGAFYQVIPYLAMVIPGVALFFYGISIWARGGARFWSETASALRKTGGLKALIQALAEAVWLRYLKGGGPGCYYPEQQPSSVRRAYHSFTFWGILACFTSTTLAAIYQDFFHWLPPYSLSSAPVIFGAAGGVALIIGTSGLIWFKLKSKPEPAAAGASTLDYVFLATLALTALTGLLTLIFRATPALGSLLTLHLALVAALFITAPYGKFVHFVYRSLALIQYHLEQAKPS
ncbi:MAG: tricarballylate utilization 4Fe-4S protein TcuB [Terriglobia bacterium]